MAAIKYSNPDQVQRFSENTKLQHPQTVDIESIFDGSLVAGLRVLVTGCNRGLGLALARELIANKAHVIVTCRKVSEELKNAKPAQIITGIDVTSDENMKKLVDELSEPIDILINNAGYFWETEETLENLNFKEQLKMIDICACGPLRVSGALLNANKIKSGGKIAMITSQGGSIAWRTAQNPHGHDYGHHMSKAAANMMGRLLAQEVRSKNIIVSNLHPGFNRTEMTAKYKEIWDIEGAVDASVGAKRVIHEINKMSIERTGNFVNCEDGLEIPW